MRAWRRWRWAEVPPKRKRLVYAGIFVTGVTATLEYKFKECIEIVGNPAQITSPHTLFWLRLLFGRMRSRWFGAASEAYLPVALRAPLYRLFAWRFGVDLDEVRYPLDSFRTFNDFFCRKLRDGVRPVADLPGGLVSPVDGEVMTYGVVDGPGARVEQVKGATYSVPAFLGVDPVEASCSSSSSPTSVVRYLVLYLPVGNYHRIHSPCKVKFTQGRHFCGEFLPQRSWLLRRMSDVFTVNERVVLTGQWRYGQMHLVAVAAANIGNIFLDFDSKLKTNRLRDITVHCGGDVSSKMYPDGVSLEPGSSVGGFRLGSTVVLVFDAPHDFQWQVGQGDAIRVGQPLGMVL
mmetsp:Transcript_96983/g.269874  ORF Transcript_96983/g.269874 Transcript_96983/m.269874 type:complete len:347 (+) Transcript_96983:79-1119(+)